MVTNHRACLFTMYFDRRRKWTDQHLVAQGSTGTTTREGIPDANEAERRKEIIGPG